MIFVNQTSFTSPAFRLDDRLLKEVFVGITGPGPVSIEQLGEDLVWRSYPESTLSGPTAQIVTLRAGSWRVVISAATPTTVEVIL